MLSHTRRVSSGCPSIRHHPHFISNENQLLLNGLSIKIKLFKRTKIAGPCGSASLFLFLFVTYAKPHGCIPLRTTRLRIIARGCDISNKSVGDMYFLVKGSYPQIFFITFLSFQEAHLRVSSHPHRRGLILWEGRGPSG